PSASSTGVTSEPCQISRFMQRNASRAGADSKRRNSESFGPASSTGRMRRLMRRMGFIALILLLSACRDEQAGLKRVAQPGAGNPGGGQGGPTAPSEMKVLDAAPLDLNYRSGATWAQGAVVYIGSRVEPANARPGMPVRFTHYFEALRQPPPGFKFFAHLVDGSTFEQLGNADHEIQNGAAPLERWP